MKAKRFTYVVVVLFACVSTGTLTATAAPVGLSTQQSSRLIHDVALQSNGVLVGQVVDGQGQGLAGSVVSVAKQNTKIAQVRTDEQGRFQVAGLTGGVHQVSMAGQTSSCRLWAPRTAPPAAQQGLMLVEQADIVRGQCGCGTPVSGCGCGVYGRGAGGGGIAGWMANHPVLVAGGIAAAIAVPLAVDDDDSPASP